ncbi:hypothetical protein [Halorhabdus rudnickae]|uniref:hypothetical protein n=1 Tax=Halorhabdus rudnickae TaxID=1775544 RepID=UPI0010845228|nr:hypothetical protein [Halorhabdus rudnickae]
MPESAPENAKAVAKSCDPSKIDKAVPPLTEIEWDTLEIEDVTTCDSLDGEPQAVGTVMAEVPHINSSKTERKSLYVEIYLTHDPSGELVVSGGTVEYV